MPANLRAALSARLVFVAVLTLFCGCVSLNLNTARRVARVVSWGTEDLVEARKKPQNPLADQLSIWSWGGAKPSDRTEQVLRKEAIKTEYDRNPEEALTLLRKQLDAAPSLDTCYAVAELAYVAGKNASGKNEKSVALDMYGASFTYAYMFLFDPRFEYQRNAYDPRFRQACNLYNVALEDGLRILKESGKLKPGKTHTINSCGKQFHLKVELGDAWEGSNFDEFEFASDYQVNGLENKHRTYGLGVPLIAIRARHAEDPLDPYFPHGLAVPMTAILRVNADSYSGKPSDLCTLELVDPCKRSEVDMAGQATPLESDLTTPLAFYLNDPLLSTNALATFALLDANFGEDFQGLYMLEPYDPDRIPVVMVHGLWSSPTTWMQMFNDLRAMPELRKRYQFWFYLYPTGQPFWISAKQMRSDMTGLYKIIDPKKDHYNLEQMVLVGHSMGGLVSRMQTIYSEDRFWNTVSDRPISQLQGDHELKQELAETLYFRPNDAVKRVITLGTPHRGSNMANSATRWISRSIFTLPTMLTGETNTLVKQNPNYFKDTDLLTISTSIDSLAPESPIFPAMLAAETAPWVKYHNVIGRAPKKGIMGYFAGESDGVVSIESARMPDTVSEKIVSADHVTVHQNPDAVNEVRRILLEHIVEVQAARERRLAVKRPVPSSAVRPAPSTPKSNIRPVSAELPVEPVETSPPVNRVEKLPPLESVDELPPVESVEGGPANEPATLFIKDEPSWLPPPVSGTPNNRRPTAAGAIMPPIRMSEIPRGRLRPELR